MRARGSNVCGKVPGALYTVRGPRAHGLHVRTRVCRRRATRKLLVGRTLRPSGHEKTERIEQIIKRDYCSLRGFRNDRKLRSVYIQTRMFDFKSIVLRLFQTFFS